MSRSLTFAAWLVLSGGAPLGALQDPAALPTSEVAQPPPPLFASHETVDLVIEADFHTIRREDREDGAPEREAWVHYAVQADSDSLPLKVRTRGNFRLARSNCNFPPLRLNFESESAAGTLFDGQDRLKLVVPCRAGSDRYQQYVLSEYLAYRIYGLLTDSSFRVRLARTTFVDTSGEDDPVEGYSFIIESEEALAERHNSVVLEFPEHIRLNPFVLDPDHALLTALFQYMIGNTDWSLVVLHNYVMLRDGTGRHFAVPYDFDFAGLVNARYAAPDPRLKITSVRERVYRGYCQDHADYAGALEALLRTRDAVEALIDEVEGMSDGKRRDARGYLDRFYREITDTERAEQRFRRACTKPLS